MCVIIRQATLEDMPDVLEIINYEILNTTAIWDDVPRSLREQIQVFNSQLAAGFPFLVAVKQGAVVGYGTYTSFKPKVGYRFTVEHSIYVAPKAHGLGIGTLLLRKLITLAKARGLKTMIGVIAADNEGSISFHKKQGFEVSGCLKQVGFKFNKWLDVVFMQRIL